MRLVISLCLAIVAFIAQYNNAALQENCPQDIVFIVDSSQTTNGLLYNSFVRSLQQFVSRPQVSSLNIRVGAVFVNDQESRTRLINVNDNGNLVGSELASSANFLGSGLLIGNGLAAATNLFNIAGRPTAKKTAIVVTANPSRNGVIPVFQANQLKRVATVYTIGVQKVIGGAQYNQNELEQISTSGSRVDIPAVNNLDAQANLLLNEFDRLANLGCGVVVIPGPNVSSSVCDECAAENGVGYVTYRNPAGVVDGRYFVQCKREDFGNGFIANVLRCPDSLFWHDDLKNCVGLISSDNYQGQCDSGTYVFASVSCGAYFNCTDGQVRSQCCPDNTGFDPTQKRCVSDASCKFHCSDPDIARAAAPCDKEPLIMANGQVNKCRFKWIVSPSVSYDMLCPAKTNFKPEDCSCSIHSDGVCPGDYVDPCETDVNVNFNGNQMVDIRGSTIVNKGGVEVNNGLATFNGQNRQRIQFMRYTNNDFTLPLAIKIKYRDTESRQNMALLATGDCLNKPGLYVLVGNGQVTLGLHTESEGYNVKYETSATTPGVNQWKEVVFHFDGSVLRGEVRTYDSNGNSVINQSPIQPRTVSSGAGVRILETEGAMVLGYAHDSGYPGFVGDVDEMSVWRGCKAKATPSEY